MLLLQQRAASRLMRMMRPHLRGAAARPPLRAAANAATTNADTDDDAPTCVRATLAPVAGPLAEVLSDALLGFGAQSVSVAELRREGEKEHPIFDAGGSTSGSTSSTGGGGGGSDYWPRCEVTAHFPLEADADAIIHSACQIASGVAGVLLGAEEADGASSPPSLTAADAGFLMPPPYLLAAVANREWVEQIKASYVPLDVVPGLVRIIPEGHSEEEEGEGQARPAPPPLRIILRPGVAFGSGEHQTTRLCLRAIARMGGLAVDGAGGASKDKNLLRGARVLDYGTGSGVLAVASLLLGADFAVGTDTDPLAVRVSRANARLNGLGGGGEEEEEEGGGAGGGAKNKFLALQVPPSLPEDDEDRSDGVEDVLRQEAVDPASGGGYDLVAANILRGPLLELAPRLARLCRPAGGRLLLSGILAEQAPEVRARYESLGFAKFELETEGSWAALSAVKER
jgi:ribosomal protein L11 methylase PrmA